MGPSRHITRGSGVPTFPSDMAGLGDPTASTLQLTDPVTSCTGLVMNALLQTTPASQLVLTSGGWHVVSLIDGILAVVPLCETSTRAGGRTRYNARALR